MGNDLLYCLLMNICVFWHLSSPLNCREIESRPGATRTSLNSLHFKNKDTEVLTSQYIVVCKGVVAGGIFEQIFSEFFVWARDCFWPMGYVSERFLPSWEVAVCCFSLSTHFCS